MNIFIVLAIIGLLISLYSFFIDKKIRIDPNYKPYCDISDNISCTKPILSSYSHLFFISNSLLAIFYYSTIFLLTYFHAYVLLFYISLIGFLISLIFAYILFFKIRIFCILCVSLYIINLFILIFAIKVYLIL